MSDSYQSWCKCKIPTTCNEVRGHTLILRCEVCGIEGPRTSYYSPMEKDKTKYFTRVYAKDNKKPNLIKLLKQQHDIGTFETVQFIADNEIVFEHSTDSIETFKLVEKLSQMYISYRCEPSYPHYIQFQIRQYDS